MCKHTGSLRVVSGTFLTDCLRLADGVNFPVNMLNQVGALVMVYTDGTVLVSHGGVEMGQGLNTKMAQIAAQAFGIGTEKVHVGSTDSDKVPNNPPTAASYGADLNGMAVLNACQVRFSSYFSSPSSLRSAHLVGLAGAAAGEAAQPLGK